MSVALLVFYKHKDLTAASGVDGGRQTKTERQKKERRLQVKLKV